MGNLFVFPIGCLNFTFKLLEQYLLGLEIIRSEEKSTINNDLFVCVQIITCSLWIPCGSSCPGFEAALGPVHITPEKFEKDVFTLKTHQTFSVHTTRRRNVKTVGFVFQEHLDREIKWLS